MKLIVTSKTSLIIKWFVDKIKVKLKNSQMN
jgi:hypothetical protein